MESIQAFSVKNQILVYRDEGVGFSPFTQTIRALREDFNSNLFEIKAVDHRYLKYQDWEKESILLIMPGGRDRPYHKHLKGNANKKIFNFIQNGGSYLGLCAGGYYASSFIEFEKGERLEVCEKRELAFFPGKAIGPAYGKRKFCYEGMNGAEVAQIEWEKGDCSLYFNGGCYFEDAENFPNTSIIARYLDLPKSPAAVIQCQVGKGRAILSGVHPEYSSHSLNFHETQAQRIYPQLLEAEPKREIFWRYLLSLLLN